LRLAPENRVPLGNDDVITFCNTGFMTASGRGNARREPLNIRIKPDLRRLIDRAAGLAGKNRTEFVLDAARHAAEDALLDRTIFAISPKAYAEFLARLDAPPRPNQRLLRSLQVSVPWKK
jgi:uncharacterized protein (DUF1778 family)